MIIVISDCFQGKKKVENWEKMTSKQRLMKALESVSTDRYNGRSRCLRILKRCKALPMVDICKPIPEMNLQNLFSLFDISLQLNDTFQ